MSKPPHPIFQAIRDGNIVEFDKIPLDDPEALEARDKSNHTPLMVAASIEQNHFFDALLAAGADVYATSSPRWTAFNTAKFANRPDRIQALAKTGGDAVKNFSAAADALDDAPEGRIAAQLGGPSYDKADAALRPIIMANADAFTEHNKPQTNIVSLEDERSKPLYDSALEIALEVGQREQDKTQNSSPDDVDTKTAPTTATILSMPQKKRGGPGDD